MPRSDPGWYEINPLLQWCDEYELYGQVEIEMIPEYAEHYEGGGVFREYVKSAVWQLTIKYYPDWSNGPAFMQLSYPTPQKANEVKQDIVRMARKCHWEYDQPPLGKLPQ